MCCMSNIFPFIFHATLKWKISQREQREFMFCDYHQDITRHLFLGPSDLGTILPCPSGDRNKIDNCLCVWHLHIFHPLLFDRNLWLF